MGLEHAGKTPQPISEEERKLEIDEVREALVVHMRAIYSMFDFYASLGSSKVPRGL